MRHRSAPCLVMLGGLSIAGALPAQDSLPGWAIPLVIAGVIAIAVVIFFLSHRKEE